MLFFAGEGDAQQQNSHIAPLSPSDPLLNAFTPAEDEPIEEDDGLTEELRGNEHICNSYCLMWPSQSVQRIIASIIDWIKASQMCSPDASAP